MATNKRKCKNCFKVFEKIRPLQYCCDYKCALEYQNKLKVKKEFTEWKKRKENLKEETQTLSDLKKKLQNEINRLVRIIDYGQLCISSNRIPKKCNAGHFYSVGAYPALRYNLLNIFVQSEHDNSYLSANILKYRENLELKFGIAILNKIEQLPLKYPELHITKNEIKKHLPIVRDLIKLHLSMYDKVLLSNEQRIELRIAYNKIIRIY